MVKICHCDKNNKNDVFRRRETTISVPRYWHSGFPTSVKNYLGNVKTQGKHYFSTVVLIQWFPCISTKAHETEYMGLIPIQRILEIFYSQYHKLFVLVPEPHPRMKSTCISPLSPYTTGKETAEEQPDKLLLSVMYYC